MTALTKMHQPLEHSGRFRDAPVKGGVIIFEGAIVSLGSDGFARPGRTSTTDKVLGFADSTVDNRNGADGALSVRAKRGFAIYTNSTSTDAIARTDLGADFYVVDDNTVAKTNGTNTRVRGGKIFWVDEYGVHCHFDQ